ncbi:MAG: TolC family protein, partial [Ramlibacter sp.]
MKTTHMLPLLAALVVAGCATALPDLPPEPVAPARFKDAGPSWTIAAPAEAQDRGAWWKVFADPALDALVERAAQRNTSLQEAAARLAQSRAIARSAEADRAPQVGLGGGALRQAGANTANGATPATVT